MVKNGKRNKPFWELSYTHTYILGNLSYTSPKEAGNARLQGKQLKKSRANEF